MLLAPRNAQDSIFLNDCWTADGIKRKEGEPLTDDGHVGCATNRLEVGLVSRHFALKSIKREDGRRRLETLGIESSTTITKTLLGVNGQVFAFQLFVYFYLESGRCVKVDGFERHSSSVGSGQLYIGNDLMIRLKSCAQVNKGRQTTFSVCCR